MAMISRVIGTTANFISWDPRVFWEVVSFCLSPKCDYCVWKLTKRPFLHWQSLPQLPYMWATGSEGETKKLSLFVVPEPRAVASKGEQLPPPPGTVEPNTSSLWMDLFSLDSVILIMVTCNCLPFSYSRSIFRRHISWQVLKITFRSLPIWKFCGGRIAPDPPTRLLHSALAIMPPPLQKT